MLLLRREARCPLLLRICWGRRLLRLKVGCPLLLLPCPLLLQSLMLLPSSCGCLLEGGRLLPWLAAGRLLQLAVGCPPLLLPCQLLLPCCCSCLLLGIECCGPLLPRGLCCAPGQRAGGLEAGFCTGNP